jgi:hypothetical protein
LWFRLGRKQVRIVGQPVLLPAPAMPAASISPKFTLPVDQQTNNRILFGNTSNGTTFGITLNGSRTIIGNTIGGGAARDRLRLERRPSGR